MKQNRLTINFDGKEYKIKLFSYRALFLFEELAGKPFSEASTLKDNVLYMYCLLSANKDFEYEFEDYLDVLEDNPDMLETLLAELYKANPVDEAKKKGNKK